MPRQGTAPKPHRAPPRSRLRAARPARLEECLSRVHMAAMLPLLHRFALNAMPAPAGGQGAPLRLPERDCGISAVPRVLRAAKPGLTGTGWEETGSPDEIYS